MYSSVWLYFALCVSWGATHSTSCHWSGLSDVSVHSCTGSQTVVRLLNTFLLQFSFILEWSRDETKPFMRMAACIALFPCRQFLQPSLIPRILLVVAEKNWNDFPPRLWDKIWEEAWKQGYPQPGIISSIPHLLLFGLVLDPFVCICLHCRLWAKIYIIRNKKSALGLPPALSALPDLTLGTPWCTSLWTLLNFVLTQQT